MNPKSSVPEIQPPNFRPPSLHGNLLPSSKSTFSRTGLKKHPSVKFQKVNLESPDGSAFLDYSEQHDLISKSVNETPIQSPKKNISIEEFSDNSDQDGKEENHGSDEKTGSKKAEGENGPKIVITPAEGLKAKETKITAGSMLTLPSHVPRSKTKIIKEKLSSFFRVNNRKETKNFIKNQMQKKQVFSNRTPGTPKTNPGRLLNIIVNQAVQGKNGEVSKVFKTALLRVNSSALEKAHTEMNRKKKRSKLTISSSGSIRTITETLKSILGPYKPDSVFIVYFKIFLLISIYVQAFLSTVILAFLVDSNVDDSLANPIYSIDLSVDGIYIVSMVLRFRTAFYHQGELRSKSYDIITSYLKGSFILDTISLLSIIGRISDDMQLKYLVLLTLLRIQHIRSLIAAIEDYFQSSREVKILLEVFKLCAAIFILAHWFGCLLYSITKTEIGWEKTWITEADLTGTGIADLYAASLYWAITTMSTVGYGDISPKTTRERVLTVVIMIFSSIVFGYILSSIGSLLLEFSSFSSESRERIRSLNKYMHEKGLSKEIQHRIRKYVEFYLAKENALRAEGDSTIQLLSQSLKDEIIKEVNAKILNDIYMFSFNFRKKFLYLVSRNFTERSFGPDEVIFRHNDTEDCSAYFIISGKVEIYYEKCDIILQQIQKGDTFGFLSFFSGKPRTASSRSLEFTTVFILNRLKFLKILEDHLSEKEMHSMIQDSLTLYNSYSFLNISCYSCKSKDHIALECPKVHFVCDRKKLISRHLLIESKFRKSFKRKNRKRFKVLRDLEAIQEAASQHQLIQQNELYFEDEEEEDVRSYSSIDEILDRNIYETSAFMITLESSDFKAFVPPEEGASPSMTGFDLPVSPLINPATFKRSGKKKQNIKRLGEIESFVMQNYDRYYNNLNLDRIKNFEVYNPGENMTKLMINFEKIRLQKIVERRLGVGAKHIGRLLIKGFRMHERAKAQSIVSNGSTRSVDALDHKRKTIIVNDENRRHSVSVNPCDIAMYNTGGERKMFSKLDSDAAAMVHRQKESLNSLLKVPGLRKNTLDMAKNTMWALNVNRIERQSKKKLIESPGRKDDSIEDNLMASRRRDSGAAALPIPESRRKESISQDIDSSSVTSSQTSSIESSSAIQTKRGTMKSTEREAAGKGISTNLLIDEVNAAKGKPMQFKKFAADGKVRLSFCVVPNQREITKKATIRQQTYEVDREETMQQRPVALFDFTQMLKKMSEKLGENKKTSHQSSLFKDLNSLSNKGTPATALLKKPLVESQDLAITLARQKNTTVVGKKKITRPSSAENVKEVRSLINRFHLDELFQRK